MPECSNHLTPHRLHGWALGPPRPRRALQTPAVAGRRRGRVRSLGYSKLYGEVAGGQAEYLRVPQAQYTHIKVPDDGPDERYVYLSDVLPTAWQAVEYAQVPEGGTLLVLGLGPIGSMACRIAHRRNIRVIGVDLVDERLSRARQYCVDVIDLRNNDLEEVVRSQTDGRGTDAVIDAVGMEAHGSAIAKTAQAAAGLLPSPVGRAVMKHAGVDRLAALNSAIALVRRGGTISLSGVYGGAADPIDMMTLFDSRFSCAWARRTSRSGSRTSCRCSPTTIRSASNSSPPTGFR